MDFDEWELLPEGAGFLDFPEDEVKNVISNKPKPKPGTKTVFNMNYFICQSSPNSIPKDFSRIPNPNQQLVPVSIPIQLENYKKAPDQDEEKPSAIETEVSRVFFNKMKENEFVDMKMDSPKSPNTRAISIDVGTNYPFDNNNNNNNKGEDHLESCKTSPRMRMINPEKKMNNMEEEEEEEEEANIINKSGRLNLFTGIRAICSFGIAAATICILFFGNNQHHHHQHNQKLRFQIYTTHDKRIKQAVHHATKLNDAFSAAHITFGGYYDGL